MSRVLVDTHALLWFVFDDARLSARAAGVLSDRSVAKLVSVVGLWEIVIKNQIGRLDLGMDVSAFLDEHVARRLLEVVPVEIEHLVGYGALPLHHRDPFDRLMAAQARILGTPVVTSDPSFGAYGVETIW